MLKRAFMALSFILLLGIVNASPAITLDNTLWVEYPGNPVFDPITKAYYPCVILDGGIYKMWYATETDIAYATSSDGISWVELAVCTGLTNPNHCWVVKTDAGKYEIWYWDTNELFH